jgi:hypothetical protein
MQALTISKATLCGTAPPRLNVETQSGSPGVRFDAPTPPPATPELLKRKTTAESLLFAPSIDPRLKITKPFVVRVERHDEAVAACVEEIQEFGYGPDSGEALHDLGETLAELYFSLRDNADRLSPDLHSVWLKLNEHIQLRQR